MEEFWSVISAVGDRGWGLTLWHRFVGVGFVPGDEVGQVGQVGVMLEVCCDEISENVRELVI